MKAISIISIPVTDQEKAKQFYLDLGFKVLVEAPFEGDKKWIQLGFPDDSASITLVTWFSNMQPGGVNGFVIKTDDLEKDRQELLAKGIVLGETDNTPWGQFAAVSDPDGNRFSLHQER